MSARLEAHWYAYESGLRAAHVKKSGAMVGFIGLSDPLWWPDMVDRVEAGWRLARGFGYAREGAREAVRVGREVLGLAEAVSFIQPENTRSLAVTAVTARLGMVEAAEISHPSRDELIRITRLACSSS
jgi:RimJ/RimL family protein N-acetyltransferase